jgi:hypothetical protein
MCLLCHNVGRFFGGPWGVCAMKTCVSHFIDDYVM